MTKRLPARPGVYLFHGPGDMVIYVGKANRLRDRVSSYFRMGADLAPAKQIMIGEIRRIEHIIVRSETEALLLESTLIKKYRPKYNVILKDDKNFQYIRIGLGEAFPTVTTVRRIVLDGSRYYGPYTSGLAVRRTLRLLKRLFPYKSCDNPPDRPCFDFQLGRCLGHGTGPGSRERYRQVVRQLMHFLDGSTGPILRDMRRAMTAAAKQKDFERAALLRDRLQALTHVLEEQVVVSVRRESFDIISLVRRDDVAAINLFQVRQGKLVQRDQFLLQHVRGRTDADVVNAFVAQYYAQSTNHPRQVMTPVAVDADVAQDLQLRVIVPRRGLKRKLMAMGEENAADFLERERTRWEKEDDRARRGLDELAAAMHLPGRPRRIEMYDISNIQGAFPVGSLVVFIDGQPRPSEYRKFQIKTVRGSDDVHMMAEMLRRRFQRKGDAAWTLPDLVLLDGGKPQLNTALGEVGEIPRDMPIAALAKREEELFLPERRQPVKLPKESAGLHFVQRIRDEAHRFAIGYYRRRHAAAAVRSVLDDIPGLGSPTKRLLLKTFGSVSAVRQADDEKIRQVIGRTKTDLLRRYL